MKNIIKLGFGCLLATSLFSTAALAADESGFTCPAASEVHATFDFAMPASLEGNSWLVFADIDDDAGLTATVEASSQEEALTKANDLLSSISGPVAEKATKVTLFSDYDTCQYNTSDSNVTIHMFKDDDGC